MVKKLHDILKQIIADPVDKAGVRMSRCKGGCGADIECRNEAEYEYAEYCDECFSFIFARR